MHSLRDTSYTTRTSVRGENSNTDGVIFKKTLFIFREGKGGRKRGRETSMCGCLSCTPNWGTWPSPQACALTGNRTSDPLVCRPALNPLSHTSQGKIMFLTASSWTLLSKTGFYFFPVSAWQWKIQ